MRGVFVRKYLKKYKGDENLYKNFVTAIVNTHSHEGKKIFIAIFL